MLGKWGERLEGGDRSTHGFIGLGGSWATLKGEGARVPPKERERCAPRVGRGWGTPEERELG